MLSECKEIEEEEQISWWNTEQGEVSVGRESWRLPAH